jgi:signal transduction histidine kinase
VGLLGRVRSEDAELLTCLRAVIERQIVHVSRMVADLLDMSRLQTGKLRLERQPFDMAKLIDEVTDACRPAMIARQQRLSVTRAPGALPMLGDSMRLTQVLHNLLENASKYTQNGGAIAIDVAASEDAVTITVSDNGIGITSDALPHVFDPFVQDAHAVNYSSTGLGIGLALVKELVEAHGGTIVASSEGIGTGSRFVATLPRR